MIAARAIIAASQRLIVQATTPDDMQYVEQLERAPQNRRFIHPWTREQHAAFAADAANKHWLLINKTDSQPVGFAMLAGIGLADRSVELKRLVIASKGAGYGRDALRLIKGLAFEALGAHRLWLDVKEFNSRARHLYASEGFVEEGVLRECIKGRRQFESLVVMSILEQEYSACSSGSLV